MEVAFEMILVESKVNVGTEACGVEEETTEVIIYRFLRFKVLKMLSSLTKKFKFF